MGLGVVAWLVAAALPASAQTGRPSDILGSKHDLSITGGSSVRATTETQPCVFCHTPHNSAPAIQLWNRPASTVTYTTYGSSTFQSGQSSGTFNTMPGRLAGQPTGSSKLCLSCHDGTIALGATLNDGTIAMSNGTFVPATASVGADLSNDHPVSFARAGTNIEVVDPPPSDPVTLEAGTAFVQCVSCHDPHSQRGGDAVSGKFLVKSNARSGICVTCHSRGGTGWSWASSAHATSPKSYTAANTGGVAGLGAHTGYTNVADNGCESCHRSHSAPQAQRLLKAVNQRDLCFQCHGNAPVAAKNLSSVFSKTYRHPLESSTSAILHDAAEVRTSPTNFSGARRHVVCSDCHNAHAAGGALHAPGSNLVGASSILSGVAGVEPASYPAAATAFPMPSASQGGYVVAAPAAREYPNLLQVPLVLRVRARPADVPIGGTGDGRGRRVQSGKPQLPPGGRRPPPAGGLRDEPARAVEHHDRGDTDVLLGLPRQRRGGVRDHGGGSPRFERAVPAPVPERDVEHDRAVTPVANRFLRQLSQRGQHPQLERGPRRRQPRERPVPDVSRGRSARHGPRRPHRADQRPGALQPGCVPRRLVHRGFRGVQLQQEQLHDNLGLPLSTIMSNSLSGTRKVGLSRGFPLIALLVVAGVAAPLAQKAPPGPTDASMVPAQTVWPLPPEEPRIRYVAVLRGREDVGAAKATTATSLKNVLLGKDRMDAERPAPGRFGKPFGVATDGYGRVIVADPATASVAVMDVERRMFTTIGEGSKQAMFRTPFAVAVDEANNIYVGDTGLARVLVFGPNLAYKTTLGAQGELESPTGLAIDDSRHRLYVVDARRHTVAVFDLASGRLAEKIGGRGMGPRQFNFPTAVAVGPDGRVYITDTMNYRVQVLDTQLRFVRAFGTLGVKPGQFRRPKGVAVDGDGVVYVSDADFNNVQLFTADGQPLMWVGEFGDRPGQMILPAGVAVDRARHKVYVAEQMNKRVQVFQRVAAAQPH